jgi:hypothetical protein
VEPDEVTEHVIREKIETMLGEIEWAVVRHREIDRGESDL